MTEITPKRFTRNYFLVLVLSLLLYVLSCAPGPLWQDSGMIQYRIWHNDIEGRLGLALSHPLFYVIGIVVKHIPVGEFAYRVNLISSVSSALAVANLFLFMFILLDRKFPAIIAAITFALSHTFWRHASIIETYNLYIAIFLVELIWLLLYVRTDKSKYLYMLALSNGLAISNHMLGTIPFACYVVYVIYLYFKKRIKSQQLLFSSLLWVLGAGLYLYLVIKTMFATGDISSTLSSAVFGNYYQADVLNTSISLKIIFENILFIALNFPTPNILLFFVGCYAINKTVSSRPIRNILLAVMTLFLIFAFRYTIVDRYAFFIPFYCMVSIMIGLGADFIVRRKKIPALSVCVLLFCFLPIPAYIMAPVVAKKVYPSLGNRRQIPYRDNYKYFLRPWKTGYRGAEKFAQQALEIVEENAVIFADGTTICPLKYMQEVKGKRLDVKIVSGAGHITNSISFDQKNVMSLLETGSSYVVSPLKGYCPDYLLENYSFSAVGPVYRVVSTDRK